MTSRAALPPDQTLLFSGVSIILFAVFLLILYCQRRATFIKKYQIVLHGRRPTFMEIMNMKPNDLEEASLASPGTIARRDYRLKLGIMDAQFIDDEDLIVVGIAVPPETRETSANPNFDPENPARSQCSRTDTITNSGEVSPGELSTTGEVTPFSSSQARRSSGPAPADSPR